MQPDQGRQCIAAIAKSLAIADAITTAATNAAAITSSALRRHHTGFASTCIATELAACSDEAADAALVTIPDAISSATNANPVVDETAPHAAAATVPALLSPGGI